MVYLAAGSRPGNAGRERAALRGDSGDDGVADPTGGPQRGYSETAAILSQLLDPLADLSWAAGSGESTREACAHRGG